MQTFFSMRPLSESKVLQNNDVIPSKIQMRASSSRLQCSSLREIDSLFLLLFQWMTWPNAVGLSDASPGGYFIAYVSYVLWALSFAGLAAIFLLSTILSNSTILS